MIQPSKHRSENQLAAPASNLQRLWEDGDRAYTLQLPPISTPWAEPVIERLAARSGDMDAALVADAPGGAIALSAMAQAVLIQRAGLPALVQIHGRDKNRLALQSEILGLGALHIPNVLVDTRPVGRASLGRNADARLVSDLDGPALLATAARLRDEARFLSGASIKTPPVFYLGALVSLEDPLFVEKLAAAQFLVTEPLASVQRLAELLPPFLAARADFLRTRPLLVSVPLLPGSRAERQGLDGHAREADGESFSAALALLAGLPGVRGCNVVIPDLADLAVLEQGMRSGLFHFERRG